jgi:uncharacterized membrane protein
MTKKMNESNRWRAENLRNSNRLLFWNLAWVLSMALAAFAPRFIWNFQTAPTILAVLVNLAIGAGVILATKRHLHGMDEMQQKIFRDAAVLTLGVGLVCGLSYELLEDIKLISFEPEISHLIFLMILTVIGGMLAGHRQYR